MSYANEVTNTKTTNFVAWHTHGMVIGNINFDEGLWESMKRNFGIFYKDFYLNSIFFKLRR